MPRRTEPNNVLSTLEIMVDESGKPPPEKTALQYTTSET